ncbi:hypothetical protein C9374_013949 [Naegleria lovaniensis]|uniref:Solute carrier family 25 member 38 homolog n=1 Tax=Naegleria lovaniensis TaxID=51637 RepID=A0AA88H182_NAELO|nr:uncharacterized protein C9374_013949 [Naegleria lovaniensis]KAG2389389.1 hypothetical protein C9374_013949 [Naegleria lovaniensis]
MQQTEPAETIIPSSKSTTKKGMISMESALKFLSGGVAGTFSTILTQPMDVIKTNMILKAGAFKSSSPIMIEQRPTMMSTAKMIYKEQGIRGLYRGSIPTFLRVAPGALLYYNMLSYLKEMTISAKQITSMIHTSVDREKMLNSTRLSAFESFCIAAFSRGLTGVILCPITVVKTRLEYTANSSGVWDTFTSIAKNEGIAGFFSGLIATLVRDIPNAGLNYLFYNQTRYALTNTFFKGKEQEMETSPMITMPSGAVGGVLSSLITHPFDMIRTRLQIDSSSKKVYRGITDAFRTIIRDEGFRTLFRGVTPRIMKRAFASAISWTLLEILYRAAGAPSVPFNVSSSSS